MEELTFQELRKIQKGEARQDDLSSLSDMFLLRVGSFLDGKKDLDEREYRNSKRVFDKIISLREDKIVKNARLAVESDLSASSLNLLPREEKLFRELKNTFEEHRDRIDEQVNGDTEVDVESSFEEEVEEPEEDDGDEGYEAIKVTSHVPEFMGTDLETYGPLEEGQEVEVPEENAEILVNRGSAEKIEG